MFSNESSKIEQLIDDIEMYIDGCKYQPLSGGSKIIVEKEVIDDYIRELRQKTPEEIRICQKVMKNREQILRDAKKQADDLIQDATIQTNELINEHEIMQQAYAHANEVVKSATIQAQNILDTAALEANEMRESARQYTDQLLEAVEAIVAAAMESANANYANQMGALTQYYETIISNRAELNPPAVEDIDDVVSDEEDTQADVINTDMLK